MSLSASALVTVEEVKRYLTIPDGSESKNPDIEDCANRASDLVSDYLDRKIVNTASHTEYHTFANPAGQPIKSSVLATRQWPILTVTSVHEDTEWPRTYGAGFLLTVSTDYAVSLPKGLINRYGSGGPQDWAQGFRAVKVVYTAGYTQAAVPERIKAVTLRLCAVMWAEIERSLFGVSAQSDQLGNFTRFSVARLTDDMKADLASERRNRLFETGEVDV